MDESMQNHKTEITKILSYMFPEKIVLFQVGILLFSPMDVGKNNLKLTNIPKTSPFTIAPSITKKLLPINIHINHTRRFPRLSRDCFPHPSLGQIVIVGDVGNI